MEYYELMMDGEEDKNFLFAERCFVAKDPYILFSGNKVDEWEPVQFACDLKKGSIVTEKLGNTYGWEIFSEQAISLFGDVISKEVQLLPVKVVEKDSGKEIGKYFIINVLPFLDALDLENSVYNYLDIEGFDEPWLSVIKYGLKRERLGDHNIFRLKESQMALFVSERFKEIAEKNKMLGFYFLKVKTV